MSLILEVRAPECQIDIFRRREATTPEASVFSFKKSRSCGIYNVLMYQNAHK